MKKIKFLIVITILIIITIIIGLVFAIQYNKSNTSTINNMNENIIETISKEKNSSIIDRNEFYAVNTCIQTYYSYVQRENNDIPDKEMRQKIIYNLLNTSYIEENKIQQKNIIENLINMSYSNMYILREVYKLEEQSNIYMYHVNGRMIDNENIAAAKTICNIVILDKNNMTFSIIPDVKYTIDEVKQELSRYNIKNIEKNDYNTFKYNNITDEAMIIKYFNDYKMNALYDAEVAYNSLDEEYRKKRFGTLDIFKEYVDNKEKLEEISVDKYEITKEDNYTQYVCIDTNGNYYIFRETATMQYTLLLDTYTMDLPESTEKYNSANEITKVGMNIEKITEAINTKDYGYIYSKLADEFKQNYFQTEEALKQYIQNNFPENNTATYVNFENEGKNYMYTVTFSGSSNKEITKTIIMQLKDGTDFVFSFNV